VPVFPLTNVWLYPLVVLPLQIFEPRYRQMIEDSLDGPGRIVLATLQEESGSEAGEAPPFHPVAGYGEIGRHERLEDGRFRIWLVGLKRVWAEEVESDRLYRKASIRPAEEIEAPREREEQLREAVAAAIADRTGELDDAHKNLPLSRLVDFLTLRMPLPHQEQNQLFSELDIEKRARLALQQHSIRPRLEDEAGPESE